MQALQAGLGADQVHLTEVSQDGDVGEGRVGGSDAASYRQWLGDPSLISCVIDAGAAVAVADAPGDPRLRQDMVERFGVASLLGVPVRWSGEVRFVGVAITHERRVYEPDEIELAETLANQAAVALALLEAEHSRAATAGQDAALTRAATALNASLELEEVLETLSREADLAVGGTLAGVYLADGSGGGVATAGHNTPADWKGS
jgi:GAF domain-containing protein